MPKPNPWNALRANFRTQTLRNKILLLAGSVSLVTAIIIGGVTLMRTEALVRNFAEGNVAHEARLVAEQVKGSYDELENDAFVISRTPPIEGIIRSELNGDIDPVDGSTLEQWRARLETIFSSIMEERRAYTQIRFIGLADGGRELVRVNRTQDGFERVPVAALQQKGEEPYFMRSRTLRPGDVYFSEVSYNREYGGVDESLIPTIRSAVPVFDDRENLFGIIIINADYSKILRDYFENVILERDIVIANEVGDYMRHFSDGTISEFRFHEDADHRLPKLFLRPDDLSREEWVSNGGNALAYSVRLPIARQSDNSHIVVTISMPHGKLYAPARQAFSEGLILAGWLVVVILGITLFLANRMTVPLSSMTMSIEAAMQSGSKLELPTSRTDEVGKLANTFQKLIDSRKVQNARVSAIIDKVVDAIISIDDHGIIQAYNPAAESMFGYAPEEVIGQNINLLMPTEIAERHDGYLETYRHTGVKHIIGVTRELEAQRKDGTTFPMELSVSRIDLSNGAFVFTGIIRDITERKQMAVMQNEFVSTVNHELRTPLTSMRASLGILQKRTAGQLDEKSDHLIDLSLQSCERLGRLVNDILDIEKIAAGKMDFYLEATDIAALSQSVVERHLGLADMYGIEFDTHIDCEDVYCAVDPSRFNQALVNLLSNAAKFSPEGKKVRVEVAASGSDKVVISVADNGPGIPASFHDKIFQRFAQADGSATRAKGGSGLGLNITKAIIEAFDGEIAFESEEGRGTIFFITLPVCGPDRQEEDISCKAA